MRAIAALIALACVRVGETWRGRANRPPPSKRVEVRRPFAGLPVFGRVIEREDDDQRRVGAGLDVLGRFKAVHSGHRHVHQHQVGIQARHLVQRLLPRQSATHDGHTQFIGKEPLRGFDEAPTVIDEQDACGHSLPRHGSTPVAWFSATRAR